MLFNRSFFAALAIGVSCAGMAVPVHAETLQQAVQATLENHPSLETVRATAGEAEQERREYRSNYFPQLQAGLSGGRIYGDNSTSRGLTVTRGAAYSNYWQGSVDARQMLFDGFETGNRVDAAQAKIHSISGNLTDTAERQSLATAQAYIDVLRTREALRLIAKQSGKIADYQVRIKNMVDEGAADEAEYQQATDILMILDTMKADYRGQMEVAEASYAELTGHLPGDDLVLPEPNIALIPAESMQALEFAKAHHPGLLAAVQASRSAGFDAKAEQGTLYPDIDADLSYMKEEKDDVIGGEVVDGRALLRANWSFDTGGAQLARIKQKKYREKEAMSRVHELERQVERGVRMAYAEQKTALQQLDNQEKRRVLNGKLFDTYKVQFEGARIKQLQLMQADNQLFITELEKVNGAYRLLASRYSILASIGRLQESLSLASAPASGWTPTLTGPSTHDKN